MKNQMRAKAHAHKLSFDLRGHRVIRDIYFRDKCPESHVPFLNPVQERSRKIAQDYGHLGTLGYVPKVKKVRFRFNFIKLQAQNFRDIRDAPKGALIRLSLKCLCAICAFCAKKIAHSFVGENKILAGLVDNSLMNWGLHE